jgi:hypothetical protein
MGQLVESMAPFPKGLQPRTESQHSVTALVRSWVELETKRESPL